MISISLRLHRVRSPESLASGRCAKDGRVAQGEAVGFAKNRNKSGVFQNQLEKNMQKRNATKRNSSLKEIWETWHFDVSSCPGLRCFWWYLRGGDELTSGSPCILRGRKFWEDMPSGGEVSDASQDGKWDKRWYRWYRCKPCKLFSSNAVFWHRPQTPCTTLMQSGEKKSWRRGKKKKRHGIS